MQTTYEYMTSYGTIWFGWKLICKGWQDRARIPRHYATFRFKFEILIFELTLMWNGYLYERAVSHIIKLSVLCIIPVLSNSDCVGQEAFMVKSWKIRRWSECKLLKRNKLRREVQQLGTEEEALLRFIVGYGKGNDGSVKDACSVLLVNDAISSVAVENISACCRRIQTVFCSLKLDGASHIHFHFRARLPRSNFTHFCLFCMADNFQWGNCVPRSTETFQVDFIYINCDIILQHIAYYIRQYS